METLSKIFIGLVAFEHFYILYLEMFAWNTLGKKTFKGVMPDELFNKTTAMAANQGLYNGFLALGLVWTFFINDVVWQTNIALFFLGCVVVAGVFGALTLTKKIFFTQAVPAIIAIILVLLAN